MTNQLGNVTLTAGGVKFKINKASDEVTIIMGDEKRKVKMLELWSVVFAISDSEHKDKIMPARETEVMKFKKVHTVQLKNDMKAGETLQFTSWIDVPTWILEGFKNMIEGGQEPIPSMLSTEKSE